MPGIYHFHGKLTKMIAYNPKEWKKIIFTFHRSDTLIRLIPLLIIVGLYSAGIAWLEMYFFKLTGNQWIKNHSVIHSLLGFVLSLLLVFRTNTAYDRWWEGRKQWGALVNSCRNMAIKIKAFVPAEDRQNRSFFSKTIPLYAHSLKTFLQSEELRYTLDSTEHPEFDHINHDNHLPNQVAALLMGKINDLYKQGTISDGQLILLNEEIRSLMDICGACERIKNTPIPFSYSSFIKKFIFFYVVTLPLGYVFTLGYFVVPVVLMVFYVLASLELIAEEIEEPFGGDDNDLPMDKMASNITRHVGELLD